MQMRENLSVTIAVANPALNTALEESVRRWLDGEVDQVHTGKTGPRFLLADTAGLTAHGRGPEKACIRIGIFSGVQEARESGLPEKDRFVMPFRAGALLGRIRRHIRYKSAVADLPECLNIGPYDFLCAEGRFLIRETGREIHLTDKERDILLALYRQGGKAVDRKTLLTMVWGYADGVETHTLETHVYRLRQKVEADPSSPEIILTSDNGYRLGSLSG